MGKSGLSVLRERVHLKAVLGCLINMAKLAQSQKCDIECSQQVSQDVYSK